MSSRQDWNKGGRHFTECWSCRMGQPLFHYAIDGKKTPHAKWLAAWKAADAAEKAKHANKES